ncbi:hypothetical protein COS91_06580 [Candidatus Desantisbacteria bacterium CG07_land_8_20_14_0_80_39_15]|uniref:Uncharacterized protein n=1 Tax=Candidatus Desantisbacteria bacterium CG07_land_8_20_14_0_80_39_15 TaxID=1974549 RepID=A0A2M6ZF69_9BACT|nr:MAG: hypothetical protein COS91_06580 [Candidatus Desantisbacteria bacterium CG07_land_8_20_14_0_80_39_15]
MGHIYEWMEDEIWDFARDKGVQFDHIEFPWNGNFDWDPASFARQDIVAILKDENENKVGEVHFRIVVNEMFGEMYEDLWRISRRSLKLKKIEANFLTERALK